MKLIDLHTHSNCSDGTLSPADLVKHAVECNVTAFALTDHDNTDGLAAAFEAAAEMNIELVPGIEFSTEYLGTDIHIVGIDFDWKNKEFQHRIDYYRSERERRNQKMIDKMAADGIDISYGQMAESFGESLWTRAHFAKYLIAKSIVRDINEAFSDYLGDNCKYFIPREKVSPFEVVRLIRQFGGIPILAHPFQYKFSDETLRTLLTKLKECGLLGMEVYYSTHTKENCDYLLDLANEFDLAPSGGSDFHGSNKPDIELGSGKNNLQIPYSILEGLRSKLQEETKK
ncbi:MAG TPA: PHP domain-containing protein [Candidatus Choladousia intestinipullorum]|nr:PHP domain-containing protein [Candidatus Choladousia intestinipullorum]